MAKKQPIKTLPWGEEIFAEISLNKKSQNKFYARHGVNAEGKEYVEFAKFGPRPNTEGETMGAIILLRRKRTDSINRLGLKQSDAGFQNFAYQ